MAKVVKEVGSGINDSRPKLLALLADQSIDVIVVEDKDRLTHFGFRYLDTLLTAQGRAIEVVDQPETDTDDLLADLAAIIYHPGARGLLPPGTGVDGPLPPGNLCAIVQVFARVMNPCVVGFGPVHLHNLSNVRRVAGSKPSRRKTVAVTLAASKYLGTLCAQQFQWTPGK